VVRRGCSPSKRRGVVDQRLGDASNYVGTENEAPSRSTARITGPCQFDPPKCRRSAVIVAQVDDTEAVAVRIGEHDKVRIVRVVVPVDSLRP
jgi:hypothetical protein